LSELPEVNLANGSGYTEKFLESTSSQPTLLFTLWRMVYTITLSVLLTGKTSSGLLAVGSDITTPAGETDQVLINESSAKLLVKSSGNTLFAPQLVSIGSVNCTLGRL